MKPHEQGTPEDYRQASDDSLELAKVPAGQGTISDQAFLETMARSDDLVDHDGETCGQCHSMIVGAQVAREMIKAGEYENVVSKWADASCFVGIAASLIPFCSATYTSGCG